MWFKTFYLIRDRGLSILDYLLLLLLLLSRFSRV